MSQFIQFDSSKQPKHKVELHVHLDGSVRISTLWEIAKKKGCDLEAETIEQLSEKCCIKCPSTLERFLLPFNIFIPVISGDAEVIERIAYEFCEDAANQGILYCEVRYCPHLMSSDYVSQVENTKGSLTAREVIKCVQKGLARGSEKFEVTIKSILCCFRIRPEWSKEIVELAQEFQNEGVVGIDVAGVETSGPPDQQIVDAFKLAATLGIHRTAHAGEAGPASNVQFALEVMQVERIGHGYHVVEDPDLYKRCLEERVHFEVCPYSSCLTGSVCMSSIKHPIVKFAEDGMNFSINRDDPTIVQKTLDQEYEFLRGYGLKDVHFTRANFSAARNSFLPEKEKKELLQKLADVYGVRDSSPDIFS